jgi:hypothetical protein
MKESTSKELKEHFNEVQMAKLSKALAYIAEMAGYEVSNTFITQKSKKLLSNV